MRLNDQYRLIVEIEKALTGEEILVFEIVDYH
ncbi:MAG: type II toxin-antitoxin system RelE/ParE family toxin [Myxococcota bacterium]|nr:type II toxin-antitoxin system RelE/ParE family toxin [Myxococcota bacterium]